MADLKNRLASYITELKKEVEGLKEDVNQASKPGQDICFEKIEMGQRIIKRLESILTDP